MNDRPEDGMANYGVPTGDRPEDGMATFGNPRLDRSAAAAARECDGLPEPASHTQGPWTVVDSDTVVGQKGNVVAECCGYSVKAKGKEQRLQGGREANARLIAASPALLEACQRVLRSIEWTFPRDRLTSEQQAEELKHAIAQATGE